MSFNFDQFPSAIYPAPTGEPKAKDLLVKAVKLINTDFTTGGAASVKLYLPADASIVSIKYWAKTQLAGGSISAATLSLGITGTATKYLNAQSVFGAAGTYAVFAAGVGGLANVYDPTAPGGDIPVLFTGTATTGNPTSGELYVFIEYVR